MSTLELLEHIESKLREAAQVAREQSSPHTAWSILNDLIVSLMEAREVVN